MEEQEFNELQKEIEILKRIINGYISSNTILSEMEVESLTLKKRNNFDPQGASCKICYDENNNPYCYYGPNGCP